MKRWFLGILIYGHWTVFIDIKVYDHWIVRGDSVTKIVYGYNGLWPLDSMYMSIIRGIAQ